MKNLKIIPLIILGFFFINSAAAQGVLGKVIREGGEAWAKRSAVHQSHMASVANHARMVDKAPINHFRTSPTFNTVVHNPIRSIPVARNVNIVSRSGLTPTTRSASNITVNKRVTVTQNNSVAQQRNLVKQNGIQNQKIVSNTSHHATNRENLNKHFGQVEKYGQGGTKELQNGRFRYYGNIKQARTPGEMQGSRFVREWNPNTGKKRNWFETLDHSGNVRQVHPKYQNLPHYKFDKKGKYIGKW